MTKKLYTGQVRKSRINSAGMRRLKKMGIVDRKINLLHDKWSYAK